ncbi:MAG TPA: hypothetical protein VK992_01850 [Candidatus Caenarcaniphilales bacterium]|nr:hypothetical protein [Candidatus Caenarcaniphilales bacterium]
MPGIPRALRSSSIASSSRAATVASSGGALGVGPVAMLGLAVGVAVGVGVELAVGDEGDAADAVGLGAGV